MKTCQIEIAKSVKLFSFLRFSNRSVVESRNEREQFFPRREENDCEILAIASLLSSLHFISLDLLRTAHTTSEIPQNNNMTTPTLPTESLIKIFSSVSSPSDLYHSLLCSKQLAEVVRPFLYHHVVIETKLQRKRLESIRDVDKKLVRKVTIKGDGPIEISKMEEHFESKEGCRLGGDCLVDLYEGKLLDISSQFHSSISLRLVC